MNNQKYVFYFNGLYYYILGIIIFELYLCNDKLKSVIIKIVKIQ